MDYLETVAGPEAVLRSTATHANNDNDNEGAGAGEGVGNKRKKKQNNKNATSATTASAAASLFKTKCPNESCNKPLTVDLSAASVTEPYDDEEDEDEDVYNSNSNSNTSSSDLVGKIDDRSIWDETKKNRKKSILNRIDLNMFQSSTKMEALMQVSIQNV